MLSRLAVLRVRARAFQNYQFSLYSLTIDNINLRRGPLSRSLCLRSLSTQYGQQITTFSLSACGVLLLCCAVAVLCVCVCVCRVLQRRGGARHNRHPIIA